MPPPPPKSTLFPYTPLFRSVIGVDNDPARIEALRDGRMPFEEPGAQDVLDRVRAAGRLTLAERAPDAAPATHIVLTLDRKSTRLNSSHPSISYAVFCLKKKK